VMERERERVNGSSLHGSMTEANVLFRCGNEGQLRRTHRAWGGGVVGVGLHKKSERVERVSPRILLVKGGV